MEIPEPEVIGFTIYTKSGCPNCNKMKQLLREKNLLYKIVDCDEYLIEDKPAFLSFINSQIHGNTTNNKDTPIFFPIVFSDNKYIGSYKEAIAFVDKQLLSYEEITF
jgi:glutaredoxin